MVLGYATDSEMITVRSSHIPIILLFAAALLATALFGCSKSEPTPVPPTPQATAAEMVELSRTAMAGLDSFSFELTHDSGHTTLSGALDLIRAGGLVATNGLDLEAEANIGRAFVRVEAVVIGEQTWMTNPLTGVWSEIAPEDSPFSSGHIPAQSLAALVGSVEPDAIPNVVLTLGFSNNLLKKIVISGVVQPGDEPDYIRVITLSKFNNQTSLKPPI